MTEAPRGISERLAEVERVLIEICDREGIYFNIDRSKRKLILRNVIDQSTKTEPDKGR